MPFTFSHAAAILPFRLFAKHKTSLTGLVAGSMAPDFEYFIKMKGYSEFGHSWSGIIWFCIPVSICASFIYHYLVRDAFIYNLPVFIRKRVINLKVENWKQY